MKDHPTAAHEAREPAARGMPAGAAATDHPLAHSPRMRAQQHTIQAAFGPAAQLQRLPARHAKAALVLQPRLVDGGAPQQRDVWTEARGWAIAKSMIANPNLDFTRQDIVERVEHEKQTRAGHPCHQALQAVIQANGTNGPMSETDIVQAMVDLGVDWFAASQFLRQDESYTVATIANAKAQGIVGHHIFIEYEDGTVSEWAWPETKASYPHSQGETRKVTRATVARIRMAARKHSGRGQQGRYFEPTDPKDTQATYEGRVYFPWYQDCFHWVDAVLTDAGEPKNASLVRISEGAVGFWGGVLVLMVGAAVWMGKGSSK